MQGQCVTYQLQSQVPTAYTHAFAVAQSSQTQACTLANVRKGGVQTAGRRRCCSHSCEHGGHPKLIAVHQLKFLARCLILTEVSCIRHEERTFHCWKQNLLLWSLLLCLGQPRFA